jgi:DNA polymerase-1
MATAIFEAGSPDVLYVIDFSGYVFRAYHAIAPLNGPTGEPTQAVFGTVNMLERLVRQRRPALLAVAMDSKTQTFRKEIYAEYKAHRPPPPPDLAQQMQRSREIVEAFNIPIFQKDGFEADDLIAAAVAQAREHSMRVVVVSADKDLMQLIGDDVQLWDTMRDKVFGPEEVLERFGVPVHQVRDWLALTGDASDNIPGVPSVGPKTARDLLVEFGTIDGVYEHLDRIAKKGLRDKLTENHAAALLSRELVTLRIDVSVVFEPEKLRYGGRDVAALRRLYGELGFLKHLAALESEKEQLSLRPVGEPLRASASPPPDAAPSVVAVTTVLDLEQLTAMVSELRKSDRVAVLVETTDTAAVRAELVGLSFSDRPERAFYVPLGHRYMGAPAQLDFATAKAVLEPLFADPKLPKASHDAKQLAVILARRKIPLAGIRFDTMLASYLVDPERSHDLGDVASKMLGTVLPSATDLVPKARGRTASFEEAPVPEAATYSGARVASVFKLWGRFESELAEAKLEKLLDDMELPLSDELAEMELAGVLVDSDTLRELGRRLEKDLAALELEAHRVAGRAFNVNSPRQLEALLFDELGLKHTKRTKTSRSTDAETLDALAESHALPKVILDIRQISKLKGTYIDALPSLVNPETGRIHTRWGQAVAATGRLSSSDPNLQNIPIRSELGRAIRKAFVAPPGHELVSADYSQIELRVLAHLSKDAVLIDAFRSGQDVHTRTAMEIFGLAASEVTAEHRRRSKAVNFGIIYGQGDSGLAKSLGIPRTEAATFIAAYFRRYEGVRRFMNEVLEQGRASESVRTLFGRQRLVPDIRSENRAKRLAAERIAMNAPIQGTAADLLKLAMLAFRTPPTPSARMVLTVHDELVFEVAKPEIEEACRRIRDAMESVYALDVPLVVDVGHGADWSAAH